jgi:hypothetical protein
LAVFRLHFYRLIFFIVALISIAASASPLKTGNTIAGKTRYLNLCAGCHSATPDHRAKLAANDADFLKLAVNTVSGMGFLQRVLTADDYDNIAAYIGDTRLNQNVLTVASSGAGTGVVTSEPTGIACGGICAWTYPLASVVTLRALADRGSAFTGWAGSCSGNSTCTLNMNGAQTVTPNFARNSAANDYSGLWWGGANENGWGVSITHRAESGQQFVALYIYDQAGQPTWLVMPGGIWSDNFTVLTGKLYQPRGTPLDQYNRNQLQVGDSVGELRLQFLSTTQIDLRYQLNGINGTNGTSGTKRLQRQVLSADAAVPTIDVGDLWWAGEAENGWGMTIAQQSNTLFAVWYSYDQTGRPIWFVMPGGTWNGTRYLGTLYQTKGSAWAGVTYDASRLDVTEVGSLTLDVKSLSQIEMRSQFTRGVFSGVNQTKLLARQPF